MLIKRFEGPTLRDVLARVRSELGPDAIVLSQRVRPSRRGWLGVKGDPVYEVTVAIERSRPSDPEPDAPRVRPDDSWRPLQVTRALIEPLEDEIRELRELLQERESGSGSLAAEVRELRRLAAQLSRPGLSQVEDPAAEPFVRAGIEPEYAHALADETLLRMREGETQEEARLGALTDQLEDRFAAPRTQDPPSQLVIGAPGVGKSTSLAKLADRLEGRKVTLVSADAERAGASDRLRMAASALGMPFRELHSARGLEKRPLRGRTVLVDTPGLIATSPSGLADLRRLRGALGTDPEVSLVVSATTKPADLLAQLRACAACDPTSLIVTRTDETLDLANIVNLVLRPDAPRLAWLGCGQLIPEDLELPDAGAMAQRLLATAA